MQNMIWANRYRIASIWRDYTGGSLRPSGYSVAFGHDEPWCGTRQKTEFRTISDAVAWCKANAPSLEIWIETPSGQYRRA